MVHLFVLAAIHFGLLEFKPIITGAQPLARRGTGGVLLIKLSLNDVLLIKLSLNHVLLTFISSKMLKNPQHSKNVSSMIITYLLP